MGITTNHKIKQIKKQILESYEPGIYWSLGSLYYIIRNQIGYHISKNEVRNIIQGLEEEYFLKVHEDQFRVNTAIDIARIKVNEVANS